MELKVWVEGIQRVICGVTEHTTCQDVVLALATATCKTGRFTLVEKWRGNERVLSPSEIPVEVLHKWGEYATDVQFILRHSDSRLKAAKKNRRTDRLSQSYAPHSVSSGIKKSLTFSGGHSYAIFPSNTRSAGTARTRGRLPDNSSLESLEDQRSVTSLSSQSTLSPYASFEGRPKASTIQSLHPSQSPYMNYDKYKLWSHSPRSSSASSTPVGSLERRPKRLLSTPTNSPPTNTSLDVQAKKEIMRNTPTSSASPRRLHKEEYDLNRNISGHKSLSLSASNSCKEMIILEKGKDYRTSASKEELQKLVVLQLDRLNTQETQIKLFETGTVLLSFITSSY